MGGAQPRPAVAFHVRGHRRPAVRLRNGVSAHRVAGPAARSGLCAGAVTEEIRTGAAAPLLRVKAQRRRIVHAGRRLFGYVGDHTREPAIDASVPMIRIVFDGTVVNQPVISNLTLETGVAINILHADISLLNGKPYGQMTIERPKKDEDAKLLIDLLTRQGIPVQEVSA